MLKHTVIALVIGIHTMIGRLALVPDKFGRLVLVPGKFGMLVLVPGKFGMLVLVPGRFGRLELVPGKSEHKSVRIEQCRSVGRLGWCKSAGISAHMAEHTFGKKPLVHHNLQLPLVHHSCHTHNFH